VRIPIALIGGAFIWAKLAGDSSSVQYPWLGPFLALIGTGLFYLLMPIILLLIACYFVYKAHGWWWAIGVFAVTPIAVHWSRRIRIPLPFWRDTRQAPEISGMNDSSGSLRSGGPTGGLDPSAVGKGALSGPPARLDAGMTIQEMFSNGWGLRINAPDTRLECRELRRYCGNHWRGHVPCQSGRKVPRTAGARIGSSLPGSGQRGP
jgi:hypothetical protein